MDMIRGILASTALAAALALASAPSERRTPSHLTIGKLFSKSRVARSRRPGPSQDKASATLAVELRQRASQKSGVADQAKDVGADVQGDPQPPYKSNQVKKDISAWSIRARSCLSGRRSRRIRIGSPTA